MVVVAQVAVTVYGIWSIRKDALWKGKLPTVVSTTNEIQSNVKGIRGAMGKKVSEVGRNWLEELSFFCLDVWEVVSRLADVG